jgi:putative copper export protein
MLSLVALPRGSGTGAPALLPCGDAMYRLVVSLHLLGATIWVGGHLVLSLVVLPRALRERAPSIIREFESGYERIGLPALLVQAVTGVWLALHWVPQVGDWFAPVSLHGQLILVKLVLLAATIALAAHARFRVLPELDAATLPLLGYHIVGVTVLGVALLVVGAAIRMGGLW